MIIPLNAKVKVRGLTISYFSLLLQFSDVSNLDLPQTPSKTHNPTPTLTPTRTQAH